jgi:hypothetical protein
MKRILALYAALAIALGASANDRPVRYDQLPARAKHFIEEYFPTHSFSYAKYDNSIGDNNYDVVFTDGTEIEFNRRGEWRKIDCKRGSIVPTSLFPSSIVAYLGQHYPTQNIVEADRDALHWEVKLTNGIEYTFDRHGQIKWMDD